MSAESISLISTISFAASGICFVLAVIFFVKFKIPNVIGDLTGKNARKSIEQMRQFNEKSGKKNYKPSKINEARGKLQFAPSGGRKCVFQRPLCGAERPLVFS